MHCGDRNQTLDCKFLASAYPQLPGLENMRSFVMAAICAAGLALV